MIIHKGEIFLKINKDKYANGNISKGHKGDIYKRRNINIHMAACKHLRKHSFYPVNQKKANKYKFLTNINCCYIFIALLEEKGKGMEKQAKGVAVLERAFLGCCHWSRSQMK